jgi:hypothetical protein
MFWPIVGEVPLDHPSIEEASGLGSATQGHEGEDSLDDDLERHIVQWQVQSEGR